MPSRTDKPQADDLDFADERRRASAVPRRSHAKPRTDEGWRWATIAAIGAAVAYGVAGWAWLGWREAALDAERLRGEIARERLAAANRTERDADLFPARSNAQSGSRGADATIAETKPKPKATAKLVEINHLTDYIETGSVARIYMGPDGRDGTWFAADAENREAVENAINSGDIMRSLRLVEQGRAFALKDGQSVECVKDDVTVKQVRLLNQRGRPIGPTLFLKSPFLVSDRVYRLLIERDKGRRSHLWDTVGNRRADDPPATSLSPSGEPGSPNRPDEPSVGVPPRGETGPSADVSDKRPVDADRD